MDWVDILRQIFEVCIIPLLGVLTVYLVRIIQVKKNEINKKIHNVTAQQYIDLLAKTIENCVIATNQTYVESLKGQNAFDIDAQKEAFQRTYEAVMSILTNDAKAYLEVIYGDLDKYITNAIETEVNCLK